MKKNYISKDTYNKVAQIFVYKVIKMDNQKRSFCHCEHSLCDIYHSDICDNLLAFHSYQGQVLV